MAHFFGSLNWTAVIITLLVCSTMLEISKRLRSVARIWLEGLKVQRDITAMAHGYAPRKGSSREA